MRLAIYCEQQQQQNFLIKFITFINNNFLQSFSAYRMKHHLTPSA